MYLRKFAFSLCVLLFAQARSQVNLQSGAAQTSFPLYSYADPNNHLATNITLFYSAGNGIKVNEIPSSVGSGWSLSCGGFIQRIQNGAPDDQKNNDAYTYPFAPLMDPQSAFWVWAENFYPNGYLYAGNFTPSDQIPNRGVYTPQYPTMYHYYRLPQFYETDREQDVFQFNFNGREGYFLISKPDANGHSEIKTLYDSKLKIDMVSGDLNNVQNIWTTISQFKITDENGVEYLFADANLDEVCDYRDASDYSTDGIYSNSYAYPNVPSTNDVIRVLRGVARNSFVKNRWNLTEIKYPLTGAKIEFQYENYNYDFQGRQNLQRSIGGGADILNMAIERSRGTMKRLKTIILSSKEKVELLYSTENRTDLNFEKSLSTVQIKYEDQVKSSWDFEYGYFIKNEIKQPSYLFNTEDKRWARLCLVALKKSGADGKSEPPFSFTYYMGNEDGRNSAVPPLFSCQHDLAGFYSRFGYYNPTDNTFSSTNPPYEPYGNRLLPKSVYNDLLLFMNNNPTTGNNNTWEARNGLLKSIKYPAGGQLSFEYEPNNVGSLPENQFYGVRVRKTTTYDGVSHVNDLIKEYKYIKENTLSESSAWGYEVLHNDRRTPTTVYKCNTGEYPMMNIQSFAVPIATYLFNPTSMGLNPGSTKIGNVPIPNFAILYFVNIAINIIKGWFDNGGPSSSTFNVDTYSSNPYNGNTTPFQYARVEVLNKTSSVYNGKTVYKFTNPNTSTDYSLEFPSQVAPYSSKQRFAYWIYGLPERISIFDKDGHLLSETENIYHPIKAISTDIKYKSQKWAPAKPVFSCGFNPDNTELANYDRVASDTYFPIFGRIELFQSKEYLYNANNQVAVTSTTYVYNNDYQVSLVKKTNSKNESIETKTYYPNDYKQLAGPVQTLRDNHILSVPVATQTFITKADGKYLLNGSVNEFGPAGNGDTKVVTTHQFESLLPVPESAVSFNDATLIPNTTYYKPNTYIQYNAAGLPKTLTAKSRTTATLYDYDNKLPVASIVNASADDVSYTSFEAENTGNWSYSQQYVSGDFSPTGVKCFRFPSTATSIFSTAISGFSQVSWTGSLPYTLSFWCKGGAPFVAKSIPVSPYYATNGIVLKTTYQNASTGWTYYEYQITDAGDIRLSNDKAPNGSLFTTPASFLLDELRLYPSASRIQTTTYEPLVGKTSECDPNGRITYYSYDGLGRLKAVRDENRNLIKAYEYNTVNP